MRSSSSDEVNALDDGGQLAKGKLKNKNYRMQAYIAIIIIILVAQVYWMSSEAERLQWMPTYIGWMAGLLGGQLWVLNEYGMNLKFIVLNPTDQHWTQASARVVMGAASGSTVVTLFSSLPYFITPPRQAALGLIAGFSGIIIGLLASRLNKWAEGSPIKTIGLYTSCPPADLA